MMGKSDSDSAKGHTSQDNLAVMDFFYIGKEENICVYVCAHVRITVVYCAAF